MGPSLQIQFHISIPLPRWNGMTNIITMTVAENVKFYNLSKCYQKGNLLVDESSPIHQQVTKETEETKPLSISHSLSEN